MVGEDEAVALVAGWRTRRSQDLGGLFEAYVGRQLWLLPVATVLPEIAYGQNQALRVDWIVVADELVLLAEVKSVRPTAHLRLANERRVAELQRMLGRALWVGGAAPRVRPWPCSPRGPGRGAG
ncbi:hypothetical protein SAM40697_0228 [Streptomyces ambofaciens]|uniref:NERD domain-containing protein n=1 Tax=Streptomyces ambofaciens TaxID=1889 RepID=A0ABN4NZ12_STRAM|nr:hypothetical protein [Streptomyces ambofaciens]ANB04191.1 hypothetical protein SAM40697_0228 [Streptomyces ambofaciens]